MKTVNLAAKEKYFSTLHMKVLGLCAILVLSALFTVSCIEEPSDWLSSLRGELSLSVRVIRKGTGEDIKADIRIFAPNEGEESAKRAYELKYLAPDTLTGVCESFDGYALTISLTDFKDASFCASSETVPPRSLGAYTVDFFTPSTVKEVRSGGTYTEVVTDNAIYYVDADGIVREISSSDIRVIIEKYYAE